MNRSIPLLLALGLLGAGCSSGDSDQASVIVEDTSIDQSEAEEATTDEETVTTGETTTEEAV